VAPELQSNQFHAGILSSDTLLTGLPPLGQPPVPLGL